MARLVPIVLPLALMAAPVWGQSAARSDTASARIAEESQRPLNFSLQIDHIASSRPRSFGSRFIGGTEIAPNATVGLGLFGQRPEGSGLAPVTVFDVNTRQSRKPSVGVSIRF